VNLTRTIRGGTSPARASALSVFAAVDMGSNSGRLKIARIVHHGLKTIYEDRVVTRLGESVFRSGLLSPAAMDATIRVLRRFRRASQKYGADRVRVVAAMPATPQLWSPGCILRLVGKWKPSPASKKAASFI